MLLKNSQYSQENTCVGVFLILPHRCFSVNIVKFSRTPNLKKHLRTTASVNSRTVLFQESIALSFKQSALTSGILTWSNWFSRHRFKLEAEDFIFHLLQSFLNFGLKILVLCSAIFEVFIFPYFVLKIWLKLSQNGNIFFHFLFSSGM